VGRKPERRVTRSWGREEIATEVREAHPIGGRNPDVGVEIEAVELRLARAAGGDVGQVRLVVEAAPA